jgi:hypothetical protein
MPTTIFRFCQFPAHICRLAASAQGRVTYRIPIETPLPIMSSQVIQQSRASWVPQKLSKAHSFVRLWKVLRESLSPCSNESVCFTSLSCNRKVNTHHYNTHTNTYSHTTHTRVTCTHRHTHTHTDTHTHTHTHTRTHTRARARTQVIQESRASWVPQRLSKAHSFVLLWKVLRESLSPCSNESVCFTSLSCNRKVNTHQTIITRHKHILTHTTHTQTQTHTHTQLRPRVPD